MTLAFQLYCVIVVSASIGPRSWGPEVRSIKISRTLLLDMSMSGEMFTEKVSNFYLSKKLFDDFNKSGNVRLKICLH